MEPRRESILGLDNIRLDLPIASLGSRTLAFVIDYLCLGVALVLWVILGSVFLAALVGPEWTLGIVITGVFLLQWGYFAALEIAMGGRTVGKLAAHLRVVTTEGASPSAGALLMRNLVRVFDYVFGVPLIAFDPLARRLGDRLAGTLVVHDRRRERTLLLGRVPPGWGLAEVSAVEAFLARAGDIEFERTHVLAWRLLGRLERDAPELLAGVDRTDPVLALKRALQVEEG